MYRFLTHSLPKLKLIFRRDVNSAYVSLAHISFHWDKIVGVVVVGVGAVAVAAAAGVVVVAV